MDQQKVEDLHERLRNWLDEHQGTDRGDARAESLKRFLSTIRCESVAQADREQIVQINEWFTELQD